MNTTGHLVKHRTYITSFFSAITNMAIFDPKWSQTTWF